MGEGCHGLDGTRVQGGETDCRLVLLTLVLLIYTDVYCSQYAESQDDERRRETSVQKM